MSGQENARTDSLVWYVEELEYKLELCEAGSAETDSLKVSNFILNLEKEYLESKRQRWYQDPRIWFTAGVVAGLYARN